MKYSLYLKIIPLTSKIKFYETYKNFHPTSYDTLGEWRANLKSKNTH